MSEHQEPKSIDDGSSATQEIAANQSGNPGSSLGSITSPPNPPPTPDGENHTAESGNEKRERIKLVLEGIGLVALLIYTVFTILQWAQIRWTNRLTREALNDNGHALQATLDKMQGQIDAANRANDLSKIHFEEEQRPYVAETPKTTGAPEFIQYHPENEGQIVWTYHLSNFGKTPGYDLRMNEYMKVGGKTFVTSYGSPEAKTGTVLPPGADIFGTVVSAPMQRTHFDELMSTTHDIEIKVIISYRDSSGNRYETGICESHLNLGATAYCEGNYIK